MDMSFEDMCQYIADNGKQLQNATKTLVETAEKSEERFLSLATKLFSEEMGAFFSFIIPEKYHPLNVCQRAVDHPGLSGFREFDDAVQVYNTILNKLYNPN